MFYVKAYLFPLVLVVAGFFVGKWLAAQVATIVRRTLEKRGVDPTLTKFLGNMTEYTLIVLITIALLGVFGIETTSFAAVIGGAALAIGLAFQGTLSNIAAGVMLIIFRPFKVGDVITVAGSTGKCAEIGLFTTDLDTPDNRRLIVPNKDVFGASIEHVTFHDTRRCDVNVGVEYGADIDAARAVLEAAAKSIENQVKEPQVVLKGLGDSSVDWQVRVWCNTPDYFAVMEAVTRAVKYHLDEAKIGIPFPQMDVHLDNINSAA